MTRFAKAAFVLKVERHEQVWHLVVQDLRTEQRLEFSSWQELERFIKTVVRTGLR